MKERINSDLTLVKYDILNLNNKKMLIELDSGEGIQLRRLPILTTDKYPWQLVSAHGKCRRKCRGKMLFRCFMSAKFCLRKIFFHHWQKVSSKDTVELDIYFYFLTLHIYN